MQKDDRVFIVPIQECGTVLKVRKDDLGEPIIDVTRDSDGETHVCRECELRPLDGMVVIAEDAASEQERILSQTGGNIVLV